MTTRLLLTNHTGRNRPVLFCQSPRCQGRTVLARVTGRALWWMGNACDTIDAETGEHIRRGTCPVCRTGYAIRRPLDLLREALRDEPEPDGGRMRERSTGAGQK